MALKVLFVFSRQKKEATAACSDGVGWFCQRRMKHVDDAGGKTGLFPFFGQRPSGRDPQFVKIPKG